MRDCGRFRGFGGGVTRGGYKGTLVKSMGQILLMEWGCLSSITVSEDQCPARFRSWQRLLGYSTLTLPATECPGLEPSLCRSGPQCTLDGALFTPPVAIGNMIFRNRELRKSMKCSKALVTMNRCSTHEVSGLNVILFGVCWDGLCTLARAFWQFPGRG